MALLLVLSLVSCEVNITTPAYDYNYPATTLRNITSLQDDSAFCIQLSFSVRFQAANYTRLCVCSNSYVTFGGGDAGPCTFNYSTDPIPYPKLLIDAADNVANNITVVATTVNATIHFRGARYNSTGPGLIEWKLSFFAEAYEKFSLDIISNTL